MLLAVPELAPGQRADIGDMLRREIRRELDDDNAGANQHVTGGWPDPACARRFRVRQR